MSSSVLEPAPVALLCPVVTLRAGVEVNVNPGERESRVVYVTPSISLGKDTRLSQGWVGTSKALLKVGPQKRKGPALLHQARTLNFYLNKT